MGIYQTADVCSRCGLIAETVYHVCKACRDKAQEAYRKECAAFVKSHFSITVIGR